MDIQAKVRDILVRAGGANGNGPSPATHPILTALMADQARRRVILDRLNSKLAAYDLERRVAFHIYIQERFLVDDMEEMGQRQLQHILDGLDSIMDEVVHSPFIRAKSMTL